jgi:2-polyprenyl-3-methyl-5-hydroxy-6-metoxy-1,4-benzoquinol methylase
VEYARVKNSADIIPDNDYEAWLQEFDQRELDAADRKSMWSLRYCGRMRRVLRILRQLPPGARVLEVGASQANATLLAAEAGWQAVALDRDERALRYAWRKYERGQFAAVCADALKLPFLPQRFDALLAMEILEHLPEPPLALTQMREVLRPGGLIMVTTPNAAYVNENLPSYSHRPEHLEAMPEADASGHLFAFTLKELAELVTASGFEILSAGYEGSVMMSDKLPLKRFLPATWVQTLSRLLTKLPGASRVAYGCFILARRPMDRQ